MFTLKSSSMNHARPLGLTAGSKKYVLAFPTMYDARMVKRVIRPEPVLGFERCPNSPDGIDISRDVKACLDEFIEIPRIMMHTSLLHVRKGDARIGDFYMQELDPQEIFMLPLEKGVGIIIPRRKISENDKTLTLVCTVVDPPDWSTLGSITKWNTC